MSNALSVFKVDATLREKVAQALLPLNEPEVRVSATHRLALICLQNALYVIVIAAGRVVTLLRPKRHSVHPSGAHRRAALT